MRNTIPQSKCLLILMLLAATGMVMPGLASQDATRQPTMTRSGAPYMVNICPVSERPIPEGRGTLYIIQGIGDAAQEGREVRFCCPGCLSAFKKDPKKYIPKMDELIIKDQMKRYPEMNCIVMEDEEMTDPRGQEAMDAKNIVWKNRLVRLCCKKCVRMFKKSPDKYMVSLNAAAIKQQDKNYPLNTCVTSGRPLGDNPKSFLVGDRLMKVCCGGCQKRAETDWRDKIAMINAGIDSKSDVKEAKSRPSGPISLLPEKARNTIAEKYPNAKVFSVSKKNGSWELMLRTKQGTERRIEISNDGWIVTDNVVKDT